MDIKIADGIDPSLWRGMSSFSPFQTFWYTNLFSAHFHAKTYLISVTDNGKPLALISFERQDNRLIILGMKKVFGGEEITDYAGMVAAPMDDVTYVEMIKQIVPFLRSEGIHEVVLEYVREDSRLYRYLHVLHNATCMEQVVSPALALPPTWDEYLEGLDRVERKELKRKLKRLDTVPHSFEVLPSSREDIFAEFIRLQRASDIEKESFMSDGMEKFFRDVALAVKDEWPGFFAVLKIQDTYAAIIFFFEQGQTAMLYNSGFDPQFKYYSNGLMTHALLIRRNIETGIKTHDFLRGDERYKYDLGAKDVNLYKITIVL